MKRAKKRAVTKVRAGAAGKKSNAGKRSGPSKRTQKERDAINERAADWRRDKSPRKKAPSPQPSPTGGRGSRPSKIGEQNPKLAKGGTEKPTTAKRNGKTETRWVGDILLDKVVRRRNMGDIEALTRSIDERGALLHPVPIDRDNHLIAGQRRLAAWAQSKFRAEQIPVHVVDIDSVLAGERDENALRKKFDPSESVELYDALMEEARVRAKERQREHGGTAPGRGSRRRQGAAPHHEGEPSERERFAAATGAPHAHEPPVELTEQDRIDRAEIHPESKVGRAIAAEESGRAADHVAAFLGRDRKTLDKARAVVAAAKNDKRYEHLVADMDRTQNVNGPFRRLKVLLQVAEIKAKKASGKLELPEGEFDRMIADVPWPYEADDKDPAGRGRAMRDYATMSIDELKAMPIAARAAKNCVMWFWTIGFHLRVSYEILDAWGFTHAPLVLVWAKDKIGKGQRLREQCEFCIIAVKGKPLWHLTNQSTLLSAPSREEGRKPEEFYALVDAVTPGERGLELFPRRELPEDWKGFGDQVGKFASVGAGLKPAPVRKQPEGQPSNDVLGPEEQYGVVGCRDLINAKTINVLKRAVERGDVAFHRLADSPSEFARIVLCADGRFENMSPFNALLTAPADYKAAIDIRRLDHVTEITAYHGPRGVTFVGANMPFPKLAKFLRAWRATEKPGEKSSLGGQDDAADRDDGVAKDENNILENIPGTEIHPAPYPPQDDGAVVGEPAGDVVDAASPATPHDEEPPRPNPLPSGEREQTEPAADGVPPADDFAIPKFLRRSSEAA